jgi:hypothetical protein
MLLLSLSAARLAHAYPNYISYGYQSCMGCHYNPMGNGPLTDYGKAVGSTAISNRWLWPKSIREDDEKIADRSGFFFSKPSTTWFRPSASYRGLYLERNFTQKNQKGDWINMDGSVALVLKFLTNDKLTFVGQISYAPAPAASHGSGQQFEEYRSREHYIGYRFSKEFGLYAGLMDKAFGIRVPDHNAFSRTMTGNNQNDQTYGVLAHYFSGNWEVALQPFIGNLVQDEPLRQKGATTQIGYAIGESSRLGTSILHSASKYLEETMYSVDVRSGFGKGHSLMLEAGQIERTPKGSDKTSSRYVFMQNHWLIDTGFFTLLTVEALIPDTKKASETYRFGPGIQYFPTYRLELRADVYNTRQHDSEAYSDDTWTVAGQVHLWF